MNNNKIIHSTAEHVYTTGYGGHAHGCIECGLSAGNKNARHITVQDLDLAHTNMQDAISNAQASLTLASGNDNVVERMSLLDIAYMDVNLAKLYNLRYLNLRKMLQDAGLI